MVEDDDRDAFAAAVRDARPLAFEPRVPPGRVRPAAVARQTRAARARTLEATLDSESAGFGGDEIAFRRAVIDDRTFARLRRGQFSIEDEIDLHGLTRNEALAELKSFITEAATRGLGCIRVVHGKGTRSGPGGPVLKSVAHEGLLRLGPVLAVSSALPRHGGTGAMYVLLQRT